MYRNLKRRLLQEPLLGTWTAIIHIPALCLWFSFSYLAKCTTVTRSFFFQPRYLYSCKIGWLFTRKMKLWGSEQTGAANQASTSIILGLNFKKKLGPWLQIVQANLIKTLKNLPLNPADQNLTWVSWCWLGVQWGRWSPRAVPPRWRSSRNQRHRIQGSCKKNYGSKDQAVGCCVQVKAPYQILLLPSRLQWIFQWLCYHQTITIKWFFHWFTIDIDGFSMISPKF